MKPSTPLPLALTLGEPAGIGPDLALGVWRRRGELDLPPFYLIGETGISCAPRAARSGSTCRCAEVTPAQAASTFARALPVVPLGLPVTAAPGKPDATSAPAAIAAIRRAVADVLAGTAAAMVTNPIAKSVLYRAGFAEPGHTEFLGAAGAGGDRQAGHAGDDAVVARTRGGAGHHPHSAARGVVRALARR